MAGARRHVDQREEERGERRAEGGKRGEEDRRGQTSMGVWHARGGHGLPKVSQVSAMPDPFTLCGWATPETQGGRPLAVFHPLGHPTPYARRTPMQTRKNKALRTLHANRIHCPYPPALESRIYVE
jgi:hypothetical protein